MIKTLICVTIKEYSDRLGDMIKILKKLLTYQYANTLIIFLKNNQILIFTDISHYPIRHHLTSKKRINRLYISKERWNPKLETITA